MKSAAQLSLQGLAHSFAPSAPVETCFVFLFFCTLPRILESAGLRAVLNMPKSDDTVWNLALARRKFAFSHIVGLMLCYT